MVLLLTGACDARDISAAPAAAQVQKADRDRLNLSIGPGQQRQFSISYALLADKPAVDKALQQAKSIQDGRATEVRQTPLVDLSKN